MFYLSGRGNLSGDLKSNNVDEFGWYLEKPEVIEEKIYENSWGNVKSSKRNDGDNRIEPKKNGNSSSFLSTISIFKSNDFHDESVNYSLSSDFTKRQNDYEDSTNVEHIEMNSLRRKSSSDDTEIDLGMIERDVDRELFSSSILSTRESEDTTDSGNLTCNDDGPRGISYTPERLIRSHEYRILTPSPRYLEIPRNRISDIDYTRNENFQGHRRKIGDLIDAKQIGASHLEFLLDSGASDVRLPVGIQRRSNSVERKKNRANNRSSEFSESLAMKNPETPVNFLTSRDDAASGRSSCEGLNISWDERLKINRESSQDDTSGIHSNDWSTDTPSDIQAPLCLCEELATASKSFSNFVESRNRITAINEVASILEGLEKDPNRAEILLDEDRFSEVTSGHDNLTRLALAIEPDGSVPPVDDDPDNLVVVLREKVEKLQGTSRNILKDIDALRRDFKCNENKVDDLIDATITLRQDTNEMRYLDDLLSLLDGELERISRRNWPFVFGQDYRADDMNLVV